MSQFMRECERTFNAGADLTGKQFYIVKQNSTGDVILAAAATDHTIGVLQGAVTINKAALVRFNFTTKVVAGGVIAVGDDLTTDASGRALTTITAGDRVVLQALEAASAIGDVIEAVFVHRKV